jgi:hypothetical protein
MIALRLEKEGKLLKYRQYCECYPFFKEHNLHKKTLKEIADVYFENEEYKGFFDMISELDLQNHFEIFKECFVEYKIDCFKFLHFAIAEHFNDIVEFLLTIEEDVNDRDVKQNTLLHFAVYYDNIDAAKLLINLGARQDVYNSVDLTPLDIAKLYHRKNFFTILTH